jgi:hypothetical protein
MSGHDSDLTPCSWIPAWGPFRPDDRPGTPSGSGGSGAIESAATSGPDGD